MKFIMRCFFFEPMVSLPAVVGMQRLAYFRLGFVLIFDINQYTISIILKLEKHQEYVIET